MKEPKAVLSHREEQFERLRQTVGFILGPVVFATLWFLPLPELSMEAHRLLAVLGLVITFWITEAIPLPVTALLGPALCVALGVVSAKKVFPSFGDPIVFLFLGSFLLAEAMFAHGLNRRIAFNILSHPSFGRTPGRILLAFGLITGFLSMWISNTAATAMMFPVAISLLNELAKQQTEATGKKIYFTQLPFGTALMLITAFAASVGGLGTPIGTPTNLVGIGMIRQTMNIEIPFFTWMLFGLPLAIILITFLVFYLRRICPDEMPRVQSNAWIASEKKSLGPLTRGEINVLFAFGVTVVLWLLPGIIALLPGGAESDLYKWFNQRLPEATAALIGAGLLFLLPLNWRERTFTLTWNEAKRIDWGTILLFGGGLAMGELMFNSGLAKWIGTGLADAVDAKTTFGLVVLFSIVAVLVSEMTSNTASATMVTPVAIAVAQAIGVNPLQPALATCIAASMGFMLPVSTPPNAIVYGSGCVPLTKMMKYGVILDIVAIIAIVAVVMWLVPLVMRVG